MNKCTETVSVVDIVNHDHTSCVLVEFSPNQLIIFISRQVKEVYANILTLKLQLFYTVVDSDCRDVSLNETALAVPLDEAGFTNFRIADGCNFEKNVRRRRGESEILS